jgi:hypothetical protein
LRDALDEPMQSLRDTASAATSGFGLDETDDGDRSGSPTDGRPVLDGAVAVLGNDSAADDGAAVSSAGAVPVGATSESPGAAGGAVGQAASSTGQR